MIGTYPSKRHLTHGTVGTYMYVEQGINWNLVTGEILDVISQLLFLLELDVTPLCLELRIFSMLLKTTQQAHVKGPLISSKSFSYESRQLRVAESKPAVNMHAGDPPESIVRIIRYPCALVTVAEFSPGTQGWSRHEPDKLTGLRVACLHNISEKQLQTAMCNAPAGSDAIGLVLELLRENLRELFEQLILNNVGMDRSNTVHIRGMNERQVSHVDQDFILVPLVRLDDGHACHTLLQVGLASKALT